MSNVNDQRVLNAILNPNTPFEDENTNETKPKSSNALIFFCPKNNYSN